MEKIFKFSSSTCFILALLLTACLTDRVPIKLHDSIEFDINGDLAQIYGEDEQSQMDFEYVSIFQQIIAEQYQIRKSVMLQYSNYKYSTLQLKGNPATNTTTQNTQNNQQQSTNSNTTTTTTTNSTNYLQLTTDNQQKLIVAEIEVHWLNQHGNGNGDSIFPLYNLDEYVTMSIREMNGHSGQMVLDRKSFYTQSSLSFIARPATTYRILFSNFGYRSKIIGVSVSQLGSIYANAPDLKNNITRKLNDRHIENQHNLQTIDSLLEIQTNSLRIQHILDNKQRAFILQYWYMAMPIIGIVLFQLKTVARRKSCQQQII